MGLHRDALARSPNKTAAQAAPRFFFSKSTRAHSCPENELQSWKDRAKSRDLPPASALLGFFLRFPRRPACRLFLGGFLGCLLLSRPPGSFLGSFLLRLLGSFLLGGGLAGTASSARRGWSRSGSRGSRCWLQIGRAHV